MCSTFNHSPLFTEVTHLQYTVNGPQPQVRIFNNLVSPKAGVTQSIVFKYL